MKYISMDIHQLNTCEFERLSKSLKDIRQYRCSAYKAGAFYMSATLHVGDDFRIKIYSVGYDVKFDTLKGQTIEDCTEES